MVNVDCGDSVRQAALRRKRCSSAGFCHCYCQRPISCHNDPSEKVSSPCLLMGRLYVPLVPR